MSGWFAVKHGIHTHALFKGRGDRLAIWVWLLSNTAWRDTSQDVGGKIVPVPRGSVLIAERRVAEDLGFGYQVVRTFLKRLEAERMVTLSTNAGRTLVTICNWDKYQRFGREPNANPNAAPNAAATQGQRTKGTREQEIPVSADALTGQDAPSGTPAGAVVVDFAKQVFDLGVDMLTRSGLTDRQARAFIGKCRKDAGDTETFNALRDAQREGVTEPVAWISARLAPRPAIDFDAMADAALRSLTK